MKVLFSNFPWWEATSSPFRWRAGVRAGSRWPFTLDTDSQPDKWRHGSYTPYPFFAGYAATYLAREGVETVVRDSIALRESYSSFYKHVQEAKYDYVVAESATPSWDNDRNVLGHLAAFGTKIILTGPIATTPSANEVLGNGTVHAVCRGEYEKSVKKVVCDGAQGMIEHDLLTLDEMNASPIPWMAAEYAHRYYDPCPAGQQFPHAQVWSSRGCWAKCVFCIWPASMTGHDPDGTHVRKVRHYSKEYMLAFLTDWKERYKFRSIYFDDDLFNTSDKHVLNMCEVMREIKLPWSCMCRADTIAHDTWKAMKDAGCFGVKVGMESGSQRVLDEIINKRLDLQEARETLQWLKDMGMTVHTTWTVGAPGETMPERQQTLDMIQELYTKNLHQTHQLSGMAAIEGSPLANLLQVGRLEKYPGATPEGFDANPDGAKKLAAMQR